MLYPLNRVGKLRQKGSWHARQQQQSWERTSMPQLALLVSLQGSIVISLCCAKWVKFPFQEQLTHQLALFNLKCFGLFRSLAATGKAHSRTGTWAALEAWCWGSKEMTVMMTAGTKEQHLRTYSEINTRSCQLGGSFSLQMGPDESNAYFPSQPGSLFYLKKGQILCLSLL